jgi:hypothetical protein
MDRKRNAIFVIEKEVDSQVRHARSNLRGRRRICHGSAPAGRPSFVASGGSIQSTRVAPTTDQLDQLRFAHGPSEIAAF